MTDHSDLIARLRTTRLLSQRNQMALQNEAATALESIQAERDRLREALRNLVEGVDRAFGQDPFEEDGPVIAAARSLLSQEDTPNA